MKRRLYLPLALLLFIMVGPYLPAWLRQDDHWAFSGFLFNVYDALSYIAKMRLGSMGLWTYRPFYTVMPPRHYLLFGPYLLLGHLAPNGDYAILVTLFHLFRVAAGLLLAWEVWRFLELFASGPARRAAWALALLGGGMDWAAPLLWGREPLSWISPEAFGYLMLLGLPHLALARSLLLELTRRLLLALEGQPQPGLWMAAGTLLLGWVHPLALVPLGSAGMAGALIWLFRTSPNRERSGLASLVALALAGLPWAGYLFTLSRDPFLQGWAQRLRLPTPGWMHLTLAYFWLLPWAVPGLRRLARQHPARTFLAAWWIGAALLMAHLPYPPQRRFLEGLWIMMVALAAAGLTVAPASRQRTTTLGWLAIGGISPLLFLVQMVRIARTPAPPAFLLREAVLAYRAMAQLARPDDAVLAGQHSGIYLTAWAPVRVPLGLDVETPDARTWQARVQRFFTPSTRNAQRLALLQRYGFRWVFYGPEERALGAWHPARASFLHPRFVQGAYAIYEVVP